MRFSDFIIYVKYKDNYNLTVYSKNAKQSLI